MRRNFYHKPVMHLLNWDWNINDALKLSTVVYGSWGRGGGGTGVVGVLLETVLVKLSIFTKDGFN